MHEQDRLDFRTQTLGLEEFRVVHERRDTPDDPIYFTIHPVATVGVCPNCGHACDTIHRRRESKPIQDLPISGQRVYLILRIPQFFCERCRLFFTPSYFAIAPGAHATERFLDYLARLIDIADIRNVALMNHIRERTLTRWYYAFLERQADSPQPEAQQITCLGIDELSLKKKHRQFVAVIIDHTNRRVLEILPERDKESLVKYLRAQQAAGLLAFVTQVTTDMWEGYANAAKEVFGEKCNATVDRFHVMKLFQEQLTDARREIQRGLNKEEAKALKGSRWLWVTNWENLTIKQREELEELKVKFPALGKLAEQRENLRAIFENKNITTPAEGKKQLLAWMEQAKTLGLKALQAFCKTLTNWLPEISNYFLSRSSNGRTEGFNHALRSILWRAFGMTNFAHFRLRALARFGSPVRLAQQF